MTEEKATPTPRFDLKNPGELAKLEAAWISERAGIKISAAQVRAVHMYHTAFQKSPERVEQRENERAARESEAAERKAASAAKATEKVGATPAPKRPRRGKANLAVVDPGDDGAGPEDASGETPKPTRRPKPARRSKPVAAATELSF